MVFFLSYLLSKLQSWQSLSPRLKSCLVLLTVLAYAATKTVFTLQSLPETHYTTLGLHRSMQCDEVKRLFRTLAKEKHPDKNQGENSGKEFIELQEKFDVLGSPTLRTRYELYGMTENDAMAKDLAQTIPFYAGSILLAYGMTHNKVLPS